MQGFDILLFGSYHRGGIDCEVLSEVSRQTHHGRLPFILYGDFNDVAEVLERIGWLAAMGATVIGPSEGTCTSASGAGVSGRCIDYGIASR